MQLSAVNRSVADRLHSAAIQLLRRLRREDQAMGLTAARASALSVLVFGGRPLTLGALAQAEQVSAPTITRLRRVAVLEAELATLASAERETMAAATAILERLLHHPGSTAAAGAASPIGHADRIAAARRNRTR